MNAVDRSLALGVCDSMLAMHVPSSRRRKPVRIGRLSVAMGWLVVIASFGGCVAAVAP